MKPTQRVLFKANAKVTDIWISRPRCKVSVQVCFMRLKKKNATDKLKKDKTSGEIKLNGYF